MPAVNVNIAPEVLNWALSQTKEENLGEKLISNIYKWLEGSKTPTFRQIEEFSKKSNIPLGYFFLQKPPVEDIRLLEYRTIDSIQLTKPSRDLIDTIQEMEMVQDWMRDYREELGFDKLSFVGSLNNSNNVKEIANRIRKDLELEENWYINCSGVDKAINYVRELLEESGVVVMMSGIVGKNTHRALNIDEFRAFAMIDEWAPLIFINASDSYGSRLFSLFHEIAHIWLGEDDLYNDRMYRTEGVKQIEVICNAVAGELLVPQKAFLTLWNNSQKVDVYDKITELSKIFNCGESVIARKALDHRKINKDQYSHVVQVAIKNYEELKNKKQSGGNYYNTMKSRLDGCFVRALCESINIGRTSYTEAYRLTNTSRKTFSEVARQLGGVEW